MYQIELAFAYLRNYAMSQVIDTRLPPTWKTIMSTRTGTCHFVSTGHAVSYYRANGHGPYARKAVRERIQAGEIVIGAPLNPVGKLEVDTDGRYWIV